MPIDTRKTRPAAGTAYWGAILYSAANVRQSHFSVEIPGQFSMKINTSVSL